MLSNSLTPEPEMVWSLPNSWLKGILVEHRGLNFKGASKSKVFGFISLRLGSLNFSRFFLMESALSVLCVFQAELSILGLSKEFGLRDLWLQMDRIDSSEKHVTVVRGAVVCLQRRNEDT